MSRRVGFVGLGGMGRPMAERLVAAGFDVLVHDLAPEPVQALVAAGARAAASAADVGAGADVVGVCVPADAHVRSVCEAMCATAAPGTVFAVHSTVRPATVVALGETAASRGLGLIEACISGGVDGAAAGTLVCMAGGDASHVERCRPMLAAWAKEVVHTGALGTATRLKLCNNVMTYVALQATYEAWRLATAAGLSGDVLLDVTRASGVLSDRMQRYAMGLQLPADVAAQPAVQASLAGYLAIADKDLAIALELAADLGIDLPVTIATAHEMPAALRTTRRT